MKTLKGNLVFPRHHFISYLIVQPEITQNFEGNEEWLRGFFVISHHFFPIILAYYTVCCATFTIYCNQLLFVLILVSRIEFYINFSKVPCRLQSFFYFYFVLYSFSFWHCRYRPVLFTGSSSSCLHPESLLNSLLLFKVVFGIRYSFFLPFLP